MKKCPRCNKMINDNERYCRHCGYDVTKAYAKHGRKMMLYFLVPFLVIVVPLGSIKYITQLSNELTKISLNEMSLPEVESYGATYVFSTYTSLEDYDKQFNNVDSVINGIKDYENQLSKNGLYTMEKSYKIEILDNLNVYYYLNYQIPINNHLTLEVNKVFDRVNVKNDESYRIVSSKTDCFDELLLSEEEIESVCSFVGNRDVVSSLVNDFSLRRDEFEGKKDHIGHYGIGNYEGDYSFVVYENDGYYSVLKYNTEAKELIK